MSVSHSPDHPELWVLRHGQTEWNVVERLQGRLDSPLTSDGVAQAKMQGAILRAEPLPKGVRLLSSPSGRAWRTAEIATSDLGLPIEADPALLEIGLGAWQGEYLSNISEAQRATDPHLWKFSGPGCERLDEMVTRVQGLLEALDGPAILVTHGVTSRLLRCLVLGRPPEALASVPGGQGVVHHLTEGVARVIDTPRRGSV